MNEKTLGATACPVCGAPGAPVKETKKGKAYVTCGECGCQVFARGFQSDFLLRKKAGAGGGQPAQTASQPAAVPQAEKPAAQPSAVVRTHSSETQRTETEETTIFDLLLKMGGEK